MDDLLKAGAFADLCCTTKETLRHYDRMGLLQPTVRAETRALATVGPERLRIKPAGAYLQWLNRIDIATYLGDEAGESPSQPVENPMFAAYDAMRAFAAERRWRLVGDLYDTVLSPYSGNIEEAIYTEVSMRLDL